MKAKRIQISEGNDGAGAETNVTVDVPLTPREEVNFHNIHFQVSVEPQDTDANAQGSWFLFLLRENATFPTLTDVVVNGESNNNAIIAFGIWSASNQTPYNSGDMTIRTSRNMQAGDRLIMTSVVTGITAGLASNRVSLFLHTLRK